VFALSASAANSALIEFNVDAQTHASSTDTGANGTGLSTGIIFNVGDMITGSASTTDLWSAGPLPRWSNADGLVADLFATGSDESGEAAGTKIGKDWGLWTQNGFSAPYGSLVGAIGSSYYLLGTSFNLTATEAGELLLFYWDSKLASDNSESIAVSIDDLSAVPVPAAVWLFGSGLVGLFGIGRAKRGKA